MGITCAGRCGRKTPVWWEGYGIGDSADPESVKPDQLARSMRAWPISRPGARARESGWHPNA